MNRDEARWLAQQFAAHLGHLRQFRGLAYVGAAPIPGRLAATPTAGAGPPSGGPPSAAMHPTWPSGQVDAAAMTWPSGQSSDTTGPGSAIASTITPRLVTTSEERRDRTPRSVRSDRQGVDPADPTRSNERTTCLSGQVEDARAQPGRAPVAAAEPVPNPVRLPLASTSESVRPADGGMRDQARTWSAAEKLDYLRRKNLGNCQRCKLASTRTNIVFGVGNPEADLMFIGEAPGFDEDRSGEPFVGAAGRRLTQWLGRLGLGREQVYIANVLKCRPPDNREPQSDEVERCSPFLQAQIRAIAPKVIVALGRHAGMLLLGGGHERTLREMRGRSWTYRDPKGSHQAALHVTYHPSYVIRREKELAPGQRNPADDTVMADLQQALQKLRGA